MNTGLSQRRWASRHSAIGRCRWGGRHQDRGANGLPCGYVQPVEHWRHCDV